MNYSQVRIAEGNNTAQHWPNLGSEKSATVIGPESLFASVKCWADDDGFFDSLNLLTFSRNLAQYRPYTKPIVISTMASSSESRRARVGLGRYITGPCVTFTTAKHSGSEKTRVWHSIGPLLCRKQVLAVRVWARIDRQVYTGVIIPAMTQYWQPNFGKFLAMLGQCWAVSNFARGFLT